MSFADTIAFQAFWSQSWSAPLRASCVWLQREPGPVVPRLPDALAPGWLRPLCFQRQIAKAVQARLAWRAAHPEAPPYWYEDWTSLEWDQDAWTPYNPRWLRGCRDEGLLTRFQVDLERLLRIMEAPPGVLGEAVWTRAALGCCERLAQLYHEVLRRCGCWATRRFVRRLLAAYACQARPQELPAEPEDDEPPEGQPESGAASERAEVGSAHWSRFEAWRRSWLAARDAALLVPETPAR